MPTTPRRILDFQIEDIVDVAATASGSRMSLAFLATDLKTIVLTMPTALARTLQADIVRTAPSPAPGAPQP